MVPESFALCCVYRCPIPSNGQEPQEADFGSRVAVGGVARFDSIKLTLSIFERSASNAEELVLLIDLVEMVEWTSGLTLYKSENSNRVAHQVKLYGTFDRVLCNERISILFSDKQPKETRHFLKDLFLMVERCQQEHREVVEARNHARLSALGSLCRLLWRTVQSVVGTLVSVVLFMVALLRNMDHHS